jgi:hypothetical protein
VAYAGTSVAEIWLSQVNPGAEASHYFLGLSLAAQDKNYDEAVEHRGNRRSYRII